MATVNGTYVEAGDKQLDHVRDANNRVWGVQSRENIDGYDFKASVYQEDLAVSGTFRPTSPSKTVGVITY